MQPNSITLPDTTQAVKRLIKRLIVQPREAFIPGKEGFFVIDDEEYWSAPGFSQSTAKACLRSPQHTRVMGRPPSKAMEMGTLIHARILDPESFREGISHLIRPDHYPAEGKKGEMPTMKRWNGNATFCKDWMDAVEVKGIPVLSPGDMEELEASVQAFEMDPMAEMLLQNGYTEVAAFYRDRETGVMLKGKMDIIAEDAFGKIWIPDVKVTADGSPEEFVEVAGRLKYPVQSAFYTHLARGLLGDEPEIQFVFGTIEAKGAHLVDWHAMDSTAMAWGDRKWRQALDSYLNAKKRDVWTKINSTAVRSFYLKD